MLGYKAKQGYLVYRVLRRGCRKRLAPKGPTYGKPVHEGEPAQIPATNPGRCRRASR